MEENFAVSKKLFFKIALELAEKWARMSEATTRSVSILQSI